MTAANTWRLGLNDPSFIGLLTTVLYFLAAALCFKCGTNQKQRAESRNQKSDNGREQFKWLVIAVVLLFLGLNIQLDLQTLLIQAGRHVAIADGWYDERRTLQKIFFIVLAVVIPGAILMAGWKSRSFLKRHVLVLPGCILLAAFVLIRAATFDHVGGATGNLSKSSLTSIELLGIVCFIAASGRELHHAAKLS
jgi:hypothetical protein